MAHSTPRKPQTTEEKRAYLRRALMTNPQDKRLRQALKTLLNPTYIGQAAQQGVFISYSRADEIFVLELALDLKDAGIPVWLDVTDIPDDGDWRREIEAALDRCGVMLMVASSQDDEDYDVRVEREYFINHGKIIIPLITRHIRPYLHNLWLQPVDFRHDYQVGLNTLRRLLSASAEINV